MDDDEDDSINKAKEAGHRNLKATKLLKNWCFHAEIVRTGGIGLIEEIYGLPIGHMGVQCKYSKKSSMCTYLLEDAAYDYYLSNCKSCSERTPVSLPNIMEIIGPREKAAEKREIIRKEAIEQRKIQRNGRFEDRAELRRSMSLEETYALDLLDELDQGEVSEDDKRLEELATLAPESFTKRVIDHLLPAALSTDLPYSDSAANALLNIEMEKNVKLTIAVRLVSDFSKSSTAISFVLLNAKDLSNDQLLRILPRFVDIAIPPSPDLHFSDLSQNEYDSAPIKTLFNKRREDILVVVDDLLRGPDVSNIKAGVKVILAVEDEALLKLKSKDIFAKLMRRRTLLSRIRSDDGAIYYLREVANKAFQANAENVDTYIQSYLTDNDSVGRKEAFKVYCKALRSGNNEKNEIGDTQQIAFKRLLWAAIDNPEKYDDVAGGFFGYVNKDLASLAANHLDELIGAAATLTPKYDQLEEKPQLEIADDFWAKMDLNNKLTAVNCLQASLIEWAVLGANHRGASGIKSFLTLYRNLPKDQVQIRANTISHISKFLTGIESLSLILSDWYSALVDEEPLIRARAVKAWEDVPRKLKKDFPDLFYEAFQVSLSDPYIVVHQAAVRALRGSSFPEERRPELRPILWQLIFVYSQDKQQQEFLVKCIDVFSIHYFNGKELSDQASQILCSILCKLEGGALYRAVDSLHYSFRGVPGFAQVALKSFADDYTRTISIENSASVISHASPNELSLYTEDILNAFQSMKPFQPQYFRETLLIISVMTKAGLWLAAEKSAAELFESIPKDERSSQWRLNTEAILTAIKIEAALSQATKPDELLQKWIPVNLELEQENEQRSEARDFSPDIYS